MKQIEVKPLRVRVSSRLRVIYSSLIGVVTALVLFGEKIEALKSSRLWMYAYVIADMFKYEIVAILLLLCCLDWIWAALRETRLGLISKNRMAESGVLLVGSLVLGITVYQGYLYRAGKKIYLREYHHRLIQRADEAFKVGKVGVARIHLRTCAEVLRKEMCLERLEMMELRLRRAATLRALLRSFPEPVRVPLRVFEDLYLLDRNREYYVNIKRKIETEEASLKEEYTAAVAAVERAAYSEAVEILKKIQQRYPGFGDSHVLLDEMVMVQARSELVNSKRTPYLAALRKYRGAEFLRYMPKIKKLRSPESLEKESREDLRLPIRLD